MEQADKYFELCYKERIHEFCKIDQLKNWDAGEAKKKFKTLDAFYIEELNIDSKILTQLKYKFKRFNDLYAKYYNEERRRLFESPEAFLLWYDTQNNQCNYCEITQSDLKRIVAYRNGNLTLNQKTKRSKGTLEIEKLDPNIEYTYKNSVLACPFCNNAKSNLISEDDWRKHFVPAVKNYFNSILSNDKR